MPAILRAPRGKGNKYRAVKTCVDGHTFDSRKEARRYEELKLLTRVGEIHHLVAHPRFELKVGDYKVGDYEADFLYFTDGDTQIVEDVKRRAPRPGCSPRAWKEWKTYLASPPYRLFVLKRNLMKALYGIDVIEV